MHKLWIPMVAGAILFAACSEFENISSPDLNGDLVEKVVFEVPGFLSGDDQPTTKASHVPSEEDLGFAWEATDTVGIYPDKGAQIYFSMEKGVGTNVATFDGGGWSLKQSSTYSCYYPFVGDIYLDREKVPVSFATQTQKHPSDFSNALYILASEGTSSSNGSLRFTFDKLNTIIRVDATLPAGCYTKASLTVEEPLFITKGFYSLNEKKIVGEEFSQTLEIGLVDFTLEEESTAHIYLSSAPVNLKGKQVTVRVFSDDGSVFECVKTPSWEYEANKWYYLTCSLQEKQPNNVIYYTSQEDIIVIPNAPDVFGANIVSNEYVKGKGIITFDGEVTSIGASAFYNNTALISIKIPDSVSSIGAGAFAGCESLSSFEGKFSADNGRCLIIDNNIVAVAPYELANYTIPSSVERIGDLAFSFCESLKSVTIEEGVSYIGHSSFENCRALSSIIIPESVTSIGSKAFSGCSSLLSITVKSVNPPSLEYGSNNGAFDSTNECPIYVAAESVDAYKSAWNIYADRIQPIPENPAFVDLGLSVMWASCNLGASSPEEEGDFYAWGEVDTKPTYQWNNYKWCSSTSSPYNWNLGSDGFSKYNYGFLYGDIDNNTVLTIEDDAAHARLGTNWRIPSSDEFYELIDNCTIETVSVNGVTGRKFTSKINGNSIFLPWTGSSSLNSSYWSSNLDFGDPTYAKAFQLSEQGRYGVLTSQRYKGYTIRPVYESPISGFSFETSEFELIEGNILRLSVFISPQRSHHIQWISSNPEVVEVSDFGRVLALKPGIATITASSMVGNYSATCEITVKEIPVPEAIDMGVSVKWASFNLGAAAPEEAGNYYAWGETVPKVIFYDWSTYRHCVGTGSINYKSSILTKYNSTAKYGYNSFVDGKTELLSEDDAASVNFSGNWRMPTKAELKELLDNCTNTRKTYNGVSGYELTSRITGNTIFLPETGCMSNLLIDKGNARYLTSSICQDVNIISGEEYTFDLSSCVLTFGSSKDIKISSLERYYGCAIRPVCSE